MSMPECPYKVGETWFIPVPQPEKVRVPCPVCNEQKSVEIILGTGEHMHVPCEACGLGYVKARGYIEQYQYNPRVEPFVIASIEGYSHETWYLRSDTGKQGSGSQLYATESEALRESQQQSSKQLACNARSHSQTKQSAKQMTWSIRYHRDCIRDLEQKIKYHQGAITAQQSTKEGQP